jgi:hypothetical protein
MAEWGGGLFQAFIDWLYSTGDISVPTDFRSRCVKVQEMLDNDISGVIGTVIDYSINSASEAKFKVECSDQVTEDLLTLWLERINIKVNGIPTGLQELSKEYYKERWAGSSLCLLKVGKWEKINIGKNEITVPTILWFVNGSSVFIKRQSTKNYKLGSDKFFLDEKFEIELPIAEISIQKPFGRWFDQYPSPYLIKKGVYKNWLGMKVLQEKSDEVISKVLPYLFIIEKGSPELFRAGVDYNDKELKELVDKFKVAVEKYKAEAGHIPATAVPFDQKHQHLIPDLTKILSEELYRQGFRSILSGLGFIDVIQGISSTRKESVLNPKPFIAEVNAGVEGFKSMLMDVINLIIETNKLDHRKLFSDNNPLRIVNSPLKINVEQLLDTFRSAYVYGVISIQTFQETLGIDPDQELERMKKEWNDGLREIYYAHLIQNVEAQPDNVSVPPTTKKQVEKQKEKEKAELKEELEIAPYTKENHPKYLDKYPADAVDVWITVFNESLPKGEEYAFPVAWSAMKKYLKRHYTKEGNKWVKKGGAK